MLPSGGSRSATVSKDVRKTGKKLKMQP